MKIKDIFLSLIIITLLFSCSDKSSEVNEVSLEGQIVKIDSVNMGVRPMWLLGDKLYARDNNFNICCGKLTKTEWQKADTVLVCGHGHNEFGCVFLSQYEDCSLYVLDRPFQGQRLASITKIRHTDSIATIKDQTKWERYELGQLPPFFQCGDRFVVMSDSTILVTGAPSKEMSHVFSVINFKNQTVIPLDYWPDDGVPENRTSEKMIRYTEYSGLLGNGENRFLYWNSWVKLAFIFTIDGAKMKILNHLYSDLLPENLASSTERVYCCSNNDKIYLLYKDSNSKGEKMEKIERSDPFPMGNIVEVYDWNGVKQQIIHLDKSGRGLMLSEDGKTLYLYSDMMVDGSDPYIYSYDLSSLK